ncbi:hypothetical protein NBRC116188_12490 [Oceaniserpentilla sp. 4NH20-0058]|uniref:type 1 pili tip component n=1 Tax=Oceaniserpentilla sp. 4NH20-0058 TaxID=3127660 RepID=UPI003106C98F
MNVRDLMSSWESASHQSTGDQSYELRLPFKDAARIEALAGLYPGLNRDEVISQLIGVALDEVERQMPYKQGKKVVCHDELGDPMYEDVGLTPKYLKLRHQFAQTLHDKKKSA